MLKGTKTIIRDCITGIDGVTVDPARLYLLIGVIVFLFATIYAIYKGQPWNAQDFGTGFGLLLAAGGAGIAMKANTEPKP